MAMTIFASFLAPLNTASQSGCHSAARVRQNETTTKNTAVKSESEVFFVTFEVPLFFYQVFQRSPRLTTHS
jgi:hypothetical protein